MDGVDATKYNKILFPLYLGGPHRGGRVNISNWWPTLLKFTYIHVLTVLTGLVWVDLYWQFVLLQLLHGLRLHAQLLHFPLLSQGQHLYKKDLYIECFRIFHILSDIYISFILVCNKTILLFMHILGLCQLL